MDRQHFTRRIVFSAVVLGLAVLGLAPVHGTLAAPIGEGSKKTFEEGCKEMHGTFIDSPKDGLTACFYDDGSKHVCDQNGSQCTYYPPPPKKMEETSWADPNVADAPLVADDSQTVAPVHAPMEVIAAAPVDAAVDNQSALAAESGTLAAPADEAYVPAEEPMAAEEPVAAEASAEQP
ncbi:MAG: hypothetical protein ACJ740_17430 [Gaiellales bacterium]